MTWEVAFGIGGFVLLLAFFLRKPLFLVVRGEVWAAGLALTMILGAAYVMGVRI